MTKTHAHRTRKKPHSSEFPRSVTSDLSIYIGLTIIGVAAVGALFLLTQMWREWALGYCIAMASLVHFYAFAAWRGRPLAGWQQALARLPLRCAGYGTKHGKPLEAAHGSDRAKITILMSVAVSIVILIGVSMLLIREFRVW